MQITLFTNHSTQFSKINMTSDLRATPQVQDLYDMYIYESKLLCLSLRETYKCIICYKALLLDDSVKIALVLNSGGFCTRSLQLSSTDPS